LRKGRIEGTTYAYGERRDDSWAFRWIRFDFSRSLFSAPVLPYFSGCTEFPSFALSEEAHHPFQVLGGRRQQELLGDIPRAPQSHAVQAYLLFQLGEQSFDLVALASTPRRRLSSPAENSPAWLPLLGSLGCQDRSNSGPAGSSSRIKGHSEVIRTWVRYPGGPSPESH
jgi:hypothetical protein